MAVRRRRLLLGIALCGCLAAAALPAGGRAAMDPRNSIGMVKPPDYFRPHVEVVLIDLPTVQHFGRWPFDRIWQARLVNKLVAAGARTIGFDIYFGGASSAAGDAAFASAVRRSRRTWLITSPESPAGAPQPPLAELARAAGWRLAGETIIVDGLWFVGGANIPPSGKKKHFPDLCVGLMADYLDLRQWPYPNDTGDGMVFGRWVLPTSSGTFTADGSDPKRLAISPDSWIHAHSFWRVVRTDYPMERFRDAIVVVGLSGQNLGQEIIFEDWKIKRWVYRWHPVGVAIMVEKMLRYLRPVRSPGP